MSSRRVSWAVGTAAVVLPAAFCYLQLREFDEWASRQQGFVCGTGIMGLMLLGLVVSAAMSLVAVGLGLVAYRRQAAPRTLRRAGEIVLLGVPLILFVLLAAQSLLETHWR